MFGYSFIYDNLNPPIFWTKLLKTAKKTNNSLMMSCLRSKQIIFKNSSKILSIELNSESSLNKFGANY